MNVSTLSANYSAVSGPGFAQRRDTTAAPQVVLRSLLILGSLAGVAIAACLGKPESLVHADPQLAFLLRSMAVIKGAMVVAAVAALWWRFGHSVLPGTAAAYLVGTAVLAGSSMLIWQLSFIPLAALAFHVAAFVVLFAAWRDGDAKFKLTHRAG